MRLRQAREVLSRTVRLAGPVSEDGLAELRARWRENLLTLIGLVWGSSAVVLLLALGSGFHAFLDLGFKKTGDRYTIVVGEYTSSRTGGARPGRRIRLERPDLDRVRASAPSASRVAAEIQHSSVALRTDFRTRTGTVSASTPELQHIKVLKLARGRFYDEEDVRSGRRVAVLGANLPGIYFGEADPLDPLQGTIQVEGTPFRVIGVLTRKGQQIVINNALHDDMLFIPLAAGQRALGFGRDIGSILANPRRLEDIPTLHQEMRRVLGPHHHVAPDDDQAFRMQN
ncbi:MAG: ABC transporter permease, partial [Myxococcota bacterium]